VPKLRQSSTVPKISYRPEQHACPICGGRLKRAYTLWHRYMIFSTGSQSVTSWAYRCRGKDCPGAQQIYRSTHTEKLRLGKRRFSRELIVRIGYQHFWQHQTMDEIHDWLAQDLQIAICEREVANLLVDFLALLRAAQPSRIRHKLRTLKWLIVSVDGKQPEKGNDCLYIVREVQCGVTLLAVNLEDSSQDALSA
jgi:hypothetical protein